MNQINLSLVSILLSVIVLLSDSDVVDNDDVSRMKIGYNPSHNNNNRHKTYNNKDNTNNDDISHSEEHIDVYSFCDPSQELHVNNGLYYIKPMSDGPVIPIICSNGYNMIDLSLDNTLSSIPSYFKSWDYSRGSESHIISSLDDTSTWRQWWQPSKPSTKYRIAKDCKSCTMGEDPLLDDVVYYTDGRLFCYTVYTGNGCLDNINEYACNYCDVGIWNEDDNNLWDSCWAIQMSPDTPSWHEQQMRVGHHLIYRPVMTLSRDYCTCYQQQLDTDPNISDNIKYSVPISELPEITFNEKDMDSILGSLDYIDSNIQFASTSNDDNDAIDCDTNIIYLNQNNFIDGTYKIMECGEYILTSDIVLNFQSPTESEMNDINFSPNSITADRLYWFQRKEQNDEYPGLLSYVGAYSLGFFTGISINSEDVVINLNGFSIRMDYRFYFQQRFFSLIELSSKMFLPLQGPSNWGITDVFYANNIEIKGPGILGLSSHHGIHGNMAKNVYIHDLTISNFDVAGFACNGCIDVSLENLIVGPQNNNIPTLGRYTHARSFIPRLKDLYDKYGDIELKFYNRDITTVSDICMRMVKQMDMIYHNVINNVEYDENDEEWIAAKKIFKNKSGWMDGGSSYGIVINGGGAAVVGIGGRHTGTSNIVMNNIEIFGIYNQVQEKLKYSTQLGTERLILFDAIDWISVTDQIEDRYNSQYIGDVYTDVIMAVHKNIESWYYINSLYVPPEVEQYVFNGNLESNNYPFLTILPELTADKAVIGGCNTDIQLHSSKGSIGLMINGAQDANLNNIYIHDIYNWADLGCNLCGEYDGPLLTDEDIDIQYGYTGTRSHGMVIDYASGDIINLNIENIESYNGEANGLTIYKQCDINIQNINVNNINAGTQLDTDDINELKKPNLIPRACGVDIRPNQISINYGLNGDDNIQNNILFDNINGYEICDQYQLQLNDPSSSPSLPSSSSSVLLISLLLTVPLMLFIIFKFIMNRIQFKSINYSKRNISEETPLLS